MLQLLLLPMYIFLLAYVCWVLYLALSALESKESQRRMTWVTHILEYPLAFVFFPLDILLNVTLSAVMFLDIPRGALFTDTLRYHLYRGTSAWKYKLARWVSTHWLDPVAPNGRHV